MLEPGGLHGLAAGKEAFQPDGHGRQGRHGHHHVHHEHEGQQLAHVGLELQLRERPGRHADGQRDGREDGRRAHLQNGRFHGLDDALAVGEVHQQPVVDVEGVVHADAHRQHHHRQRGHGQADLQLFHEPVADEGAHGERQAAGHDGAQVAVDQEHQHDDGGIHVEHHRQLALFHLVVDRRQYAGVAGGEADDDAVLPVVLAEALHGVDHALDGGRLVVGQEQVDRRHAAVLAHHAGQAGDLGGQGRVVAGVQRDHRHLRIAFVVALVVEPQLPRIRRHGEHALHRLHGPGEAVLVEPDIDVAATVGRCLEDHGQPVQAGVVAAGDGDGVAVEARVRAQLRRAGLQRTHHPVAALPDGGSEHHGRGRQHQQRVAGLCHAGEHAQPARAPLALHQRRIGVALADVEVRSRHRQHHQVGDDLVGHAQRGGDRQLAHHRDRDEQQGDERYEGGHQGQRARNQQAGEAVAAGVVVGAAVRYLPHDEVDLLHTMRYADGEHQEGHEHAERIQAEAEQLERAELPHQRGERAHDRQQREAHRPAVPVHRQRRQHQGYGAELQHRARAVGDVADLLGEADDLDLEIRILELRADALFQQVVVGHVVQLRVVGAHLQQLGGDHGARLVARDQRTHESALRRGTANARDGLGCELSGRDGAVDQRVGPEAFLGDLVDEAVGRPDRAHAQPLDAGQVADGLGDLVHPLQRGGRPDAAVPRLHHDVQAVGAQHVVAVLLEGLDVLVPDRHLFLEARVHAQLHREPGHHRGEKHQRGEQHRPVVEDDLFDALHGADEGGPGRRCGVGHGRLSAGGRVAVGRSEVPRQGEAQVVAVAQRLVEHPLAAEEGRVVDRRLPLGRVLHEAHREVDRLRALHELAGRIGRAALDGLEVVDLGDHLPARDDRAVVHPAEVQVVSPRRLRAHGRGRRPRVELLPPAPGARGDRIGAVQLLEVRVTHHHGFRHQGGGAGAQQVEQPLAVAGRDAVEAGQVPLELLLVHPAVAALRGAPGGGGIQRHRIARPVGQFRADGPVAHGHVRAHAVEPAVLRERPARAPRAVHVAAEIRALVLVVQHVGAKVERSALRLVAQRHAPLPAVPGLGLDEPVGVVARAEAVGGGPVAARGGHVVAVPVRLHVGLDIEAVAQSAGDAHHRRGQQHLLELGAGLRGAHHVHRVRAVDAAGQEQAFAPVDHLVADAHARALVSDVEGLAHPQVQQPGLEPQVTARIRRQPVPQPGGRARSQVAGGIGGGEVLDPVHPPEKGDVGRQLQQQFVAALEVGGEGVALGVVEVALVAQGRGGRQAARGCPVASGACVDEGAGRVLHANAGADGDRRVEAAAEILRLEGHGVRAGAEQCGRGQGGRAQVQGVLGGHAVLLGGAGGSALADGAEVVGGVEARLEPRAGGLGEPADVLADTDRVRVEHVAAFGQVVLHHGHHVAAAGLVDGNQEAFAHLGQLVLAVEVIHQHRRPAVLVEIDGALRRGVPHAGLDRRLDHPHAVQFVAAVRLRDEVRPGDVLELRLEVERAERVVRHVHFLLSDQLPVEAVQRAVEHLGLVQRVLVLHADLRRVMRIGGHAPHPPLAREVVEGFVLCLVDVLRDRQGLAGQRRGRYVAEIHVELHGRQRGQLRGALGAGGDEHGLLRIGADPFRAAATRRHRGDRALVVDAHAAVAHLGVPHRFHTGGRDGKWVAGHGGFLQAPAVLIELRGAQVLAGVGGDEIRHAAGAVGRIHVHAVVLALLEHGQLAGAELVRVLVRVGCVDGQERLFVLVLPVIHAQLAPFPAGLRGFGSLPRGNGTVLAAFLFRAGRRELVQLGEVGRGSDEWKREQLGREDGRAGCAKEGGWGLADHGILRGLGGFDRSPARHGGGVRGTV